MNDIDVVAKNVRRFRGERHLSLGELARRAGISKQTLSTIEQGDGNPTVGTVASIASALGITVRTMLTEWGSRVALYRAGEASWERDLGGEMRGLSRIYGFGNVSNAILRLEFVEDVEAQQPLSPGSLHQAYVVTGRVELGPLGDLVTALEGDFVRFPADEPYLFRAVDGPSLLHLVTTHPQVPSTGQAPSVR